MTSIILPAPLALLVSTLPVDLQNLAYALYQLISAVPGGNVSGPLSSVVGDIAIFNNVTGTLISDSGVLVSTVVQGPGSAINNNIAVYDLTTGKLIKDGGQTIAQVIAAAVAASGNVTGPGSSTTGDLPSFTDTSGKVIQDSGILAANVAQGPASAVNNNVVSFNGTGGKTLKDSGILSTSIVLGPASAVNGNVAVFDTTSGKLIKDGGPLPSGGFAQFGGVKLTGGNITTVSTTFVDLTGATVTLTTGAHRCLVSCILSTDNNTANVNIFDLLIDGVSVGNGNLGIFQVGGSSSIDFVSNFFFVTDVLSAASHVFKLQWRVGGGTGDVRASNPPFWLQVLETTLTT